MRFMYEDFHHKLCHWGAHLVHGLASIYLVRRDRVAATIKLVDAQKKAGTRICVNGMKCWSNLLR